MNTQHLEAGKNRDHGGQGRGATNASRQPWQKPTSSQLRSLCPWLDSVVLAGFCKNGASKNGSDDQFWAERTDAPPHHEAAKRHDGGGPDQDRHDALPSMPQQLDHGSRELSALNSTCA